MAAATHLPVLLQVQRLQQPEASAAGRLEVAELSPVWVTNLQAAASPWSWGMAVSAQQ